VVILSPDIKSSSKGEVKVVHEDVWGMDVQIHAFLDSALVGDEWLTPRCCRFTSPGTHWIGGWLGPRAGLDDMEKRKFLTLPQLELRPLGRPAINQSIYPLRYPSSQPSSALTD
jgi:hypothetical protein